MFLLALLIALVMGWSTRGRLRNLSRLTLRWPWIPILTVVGLVALTRSSLSATGWLSRSLIGLSYVLIACWLALNLSERSGVGIGLGVALVGWLLNAIPILVNGRMPVSRVAMRRVGLTDLQDGALLYRHEIADHHTRLRWLGDVIAARWLGAVISVGDLLLLLGIALVVVSGMRVRAERS